MGRDEEVDAAAVIRIAGCLLFPSHRYNICHIFLVTRKQIERLIEQKEQKLEPATVIGIVKMAAIAVTAKISSIKKMTIGRVQERLQELLKGKNISAR